MKAWMLFVLLTVVVLVGLGTGIGVRQDRSSSAEVTGSQLEVSHNFALPSMERQLSGRRGYLHEADQVFFGELLGGDGCPDTQATFAFYASGSFAVKKVLKGKLKEGDLVSGRTLIACLPPSYYFPFFQAMPPVLVVGIWEGSAPLEEELGSVSVPFLGGKDQIHYIKVTDLIAYSERDEQRIEQIVLQMLTCREAHQVFWVGQPPGTARVVVDPEQPPEGTSISFSLCITEENFDSERGEVEVWHYVAYDFGFQGKESRYGQLDGIAVRDLFNMSSDVIEGVGEAHDGIWWLAEPVGGAGARSSFYMMLPRGRYEPYLSDQDVYVFSQDNDLAPPWLEEGKPLDILRGALWIPKPKVGAASP